MYPWVKLSWSIHLIHFDTSQKEVSYKVSNVYEVRYLLIDVGLWKSERSILNIKKKFGAFP